MHRIRYPFVAIILASAVAATALPADAETWSDTTGKFQIEAEYQGVSGSSVILMKSDGSTVSVPIAKLSDSSRARAKELYEQQKSGAPAPAVEKASGTMSRESGSLMLSVTPPKPIDVDPMPAFPNDASLQQTIDFVADQLMAGHPEVLWHMLPGEIRDALDREDIRAKAGPFIKEQAATGKATEAVMIKVMELLISKKEFVLNSQLMSQVPPNVLPIVKQAYDPAVGLIYEFSQMSDGFEDIENRTVTELVDAHGPLVGGHLKALLALAPPQIVEGIRGSIVATETDGTNGTVSATGPDGQSQVTEFSRYDGRWIPKKLADAWIETKDDLEGKLTESMATVSEQSAQSVMMAAMFVGMANSVIQPLSDASTQEEFDAALMQATQMAGSMQAGAAGN